MPIPIGVNIEDGTWIDIVQIQSLYETTEDVGSSLGRYSASDIANDVMEKEGSTPRKTGSKIEMYDPEGTIASLLGGIGL